MVLWNAFNFNPTRATTWGRSRPNRLRESTLVQASMEELSAEPWSATAAQLFLIVGLSVLDDALEEPVVSLRRHSGRDRPWYGLAEVDVNGCQAGI
jgi:hypothetical protein